MKIKYKDTTESISEIEVNGEYWFFGRTYWRINENVFTRFDIETTKTFFHSVSLNEVNNIGSELKSMKLIASECKKEDYDNAFKELINQLILRHNEQERK